MTEEVIFTELPPRPTRRPSPEDEAKARLVREKTEEILTQDPNAARPWAQVYSFPADKKGAATGTTQAIRGGRKGFSPEGAFEAKQRIVEGQNVVFVRYNGEEGVARLAETRAKAQAEAANQSAE